MMKLMDPSKIADNLLPISLAIIAAIITAVVFSPLLALGFEVKYTVVTDIISSFFAFIG